MLIPVFLGGCRKGEDDPLMSLKSRKSRMAGSWNLSGGQLTESVDDHFNTVKYSWKYTFKAGRFERRDTYYPPESGTYILSLNVDKNGTYSLKELFEGRELQAEGAWDFLQKSGDVKNKEEVNFIIGKINKGSTGDYHLFNWGGINMRYRIKELRDKKLVLTINSDAVTNPNAYDLGYNGELIFTQD